jgi:hypothetical protein
MLRLLRCSVLLVLVAGCQSATVQTPETVASREQVLLQTPARFGRMLNGVDMVSWEAFGQLLLTPSTLYFTFHGSSLDLSYRRIESVEVRPVQQWHFYPLGKPTLLPDQFFVNGPREVCWQGCVFSVDQETARVAATIVAGRSAQVDAFGRLEPPGDVVLVVGCFRPNVYWRVKPHYLLAHDAAAPKTVINRLRGFTDGASGRFGESWARTLPAVIEDWRFAPPDDELLAPLCNRYALAKAELLARTGTATSRLLVAELGHIALEESISADYQVSVEATFTISLTYLDLMPPKLGKWRRFGRLIRRPLDTWRTLDDATFGGLIEDVARAGALDVRRELALKEP